MQEPAPLDLLPEVRSKYRPATARTRPPRPRGRARHGRPAVRRPAVRRAVGVSLDPQTLTRLYAGLLEPSCNLVPAMVRGYRRLDPCPMGDLDEPPDLPKAKQEIDDAGAAGSPVSVVADPGVPRAVERNVVQTLRKIGLAAAPGRRGDHPRAALRAARRAPGGVRRAGREQGLRPRPAGDDRRGDAPGVGRAGRRRLGRRRPDRRREGLRGADRQRAPAAFLSERLDIENCFRFQPLFGLDLSSLCIS